MPSWDAYHSLSLDTLNDVIVVQSENVKVSSSDRFAPITTLVNELQWEKTYGVVDITESGIVTVGPIFVYAKEYFLNVSIVSGSSDTSSDVTEPIDAHSSVLEIKNLPEITLKIGSAPGTFLCASFVFDEYESIHCPTSVRVFGNVNNSKLLMELKA